MPNIRKPDGDKRIANLGYRVCRIGLHGKDKPFATTKVSLFQNSLQSGTVIYLCDECADKRLQGFRDTYNHVTTEATGLTLAHPEDLVTLAPRLAEAVGTALTYSKKSSTPRVIFHPVRHVLSSTQYNLDSIKQEFKSQYSRNSKYSYEAGGKWGTPWRKS